MQIERLEGWKSQLVQTVATVATDLKQKPKSKRMCEENYGPRFTTWIHKTYLKFFAGVNSEGSHNNASQTSPFKYVFSAIFIKQEFDLFKYKIPFCMQSHKRNRHC